VAPKALNDQRDVSCVAGNGSQGLVDRPAKTTAKQKAASQPLFLAKIDAEFSQGYVGSGVISLF